MADMTSDAVLILDDFTSQSGTSTYGTAWQGFTDRVMGGRSDMRAGISRESGDSFLRMAGVVSLENNGGFIQARLPLVVLRRAGTRRHRVANGTHTLRRVSLFVRAQARHARSSAPSVDRDRGGYGCLRGGYRGQAYRAVQVETASDALQPTSKPIGCCRAGVAFPPDYPSVRSHREPRRVHCNRHTDLAGKLIYIIHKKHNDLLVLHRVAILTSEAPANQTVNKTRGTSDDVNVEYRLRTSDSEGFQASVRNEHAFKLLFAVFLRAREVQSDERRARGQELVEVTTSPRGATRREVRERLRGERVRQ